MKVTQNSLAAIALLRVKLSMRGIAIVITRGKAAG
jgi:hypothetical protein